MHHRDGVSCWQSIFEKSSLVRGWKFLLFDKGLFKDKWPEEKMKVLHAAETIRGGVATVIRHNIRAQVQELGAESVLVLIPGEQAEDLQDAEPFTGFFFERSGRNLRSFAGFLKKFVQIIRREKPDIIHLHSSFAGVMGRLALAVLYPFGGRPRVVYCPHAFGFLMEGAVWKKKIYALIERVLLPLTDAVICVSDYERKTAIGYGVPGRKLQVIYNGVPIPDKPAVKPDKDAGKTTQLLFVGRFDYQKGFDLLLQAMAALEGAPFHLTVVGGAVHSDEKPPERPNITYAGWVAADRVGDYIAACDIVVMPSRWESFGLVAAEAGAYGCPVLASDCCSLPEIIRDQETGRLFSSGNVSSMIAILEETSGEQWRAMGRAARPYIELMFSIEQMTNKTIHLYHQVIKTRKKK